LQITHITFLYRVSYRYDSMEYLIGISSI